jgi:DNA-binding transcriptional LysR family regulator
MRALANEQLVLFPRQPRPGWIDVVLEACRKAGFRPAIAQEVQDLSTAVTLVAAGLGIALVPRAARAIRLDGVVYRSLRAPQPTTRLLAVYRRDRRPPVVDSFLDVAREVVREEAARP